MVDRVDSVDGAGDHRQSRSLSLCRRGTTSLECQHRRTCQEEDVGGTHPVEEKALIVFWVGVGSMSLVKLRSTVSRWGELNAVRGEPSRISQPRVLCRPGWDCPPPRLCRGLLLSAAFADPEALSEASPATAISDTAICVLPPAFLLLCGHRISWPTFKGLSLIPFCVRLCEALLRILQARITLLVDPRPHLHNMLQQFNGPIHLPITQIRRSEHV